MGFFGDLIGNIAGPIVGGLFGSESDDKAADSSAQNTAAVNAANAEINRQNIEMQREFAQHGIRWKIDDAKAAGVHPLYALGAQTTSFQPSSIGAAADPYVRGGHLRDMGNDIGRAVRSTLSSTERLQEKLLAAQIRQTEVDTDLNISREARMARSSGQIGPSMPSGRDSGDIIPEIQHVRTKHGLMRIPSDAYAQIMENYWPESWRYMFREGLEDFSNLGRSTGEWLRSKWDGR